MILLAVVLLLAGCGQSEVDLELDAARDRVEVALADDVPPVLTAGAAGDGTVRSVQVAGDPAENCAGAPLPL